MKNKNLFSKKELDEYFDKSITSAHLEKYLPLIVIVVLGIFIIGAFITLRLLK